MSNPIYVSYPQNKPHPQPPPRLRGGGYDGMVLGFQQVKFQIYFRLNNVFS
jgi:hypothetical protein